MFHHPCDIPSFSIPCIESLLVRNVKFSPAEGTPAPTMWLDPYDYDSSEIVIFIYVD